MDKDINSNKGDKHILYCKKRDLQSELEIALRFQASQIRSKSEYIEEGKKKYLILFSLEKQRQTNNVINKLERADGSFATTNHEIVK